MYHIKVIYTAIYLKQDGLWYKASVAKWLDTEPGVKSI